MSLRTDLIRLAHDKPEFRKTLLSLLKQGASYWDDYYEDEGYDSDEQFYPDDDIPVEDCPDSELDDSEKIISKEARAFIKKMANEFKRQGWRIVYASADDYDVVDDRWLISSTIELNLKAGQTLQVGRKKITADRNLEADLTLHLYSYEGEQEHGTTETQIDVDDFRQDAIAWTCPRNDLEEFDLNDLGGNGKVRRIKQELYRIQDIEKFCENFTKDFMLNSTRSKFKKKADMDLRDELIRLAYNKPELRSKLLPLLKEAKAFSSQAQLDEYIDSLETEAGKEKARKTHTVEEKGDGKGKSDEQGYLSSLWEAIKDLAAALVGLKDEADEAEKSNTDMKKKLMEQVGWGDMNPDDVEFVMVDGDFGCQPCDAKGKDGFKKMDVSDAEAKKAMASQAKANKATKKFEGKQKEHDEKKAEAEKAEKKQKSKGKKPRENGELPIGNRGRDKKKREEMSKAELVKAYQEAIRESDMSPEDKKKAIEQSKKPNFDPEAALGAMGDDDEDDGGKTATLRNKIIRLAYDKPELRKKLLPLLKQAEMYDDDGRRIYDFPRSAVEWDKHAKDIVRELRRADGPWGSVLLGKKGRNGRVIYFVPDYSHLQDGRGSKAKWIPGTTYGDIRDTAWQCDREMPAAAMTVLERMGYESRYGGSVYVHEDDAIWIDFDQSDNLAKGHCYIVVQPMPGIGIYKNANSMPSTNRRSIVGPKAGKHRREWCDWIKSDIQAKLEATGCPQSAIEQLISRICGYQYGIMWDKGFYGVDKDKFTHFRTTEEIKDWLKGKPYTLTNFNENVRDWAKSYPKIIQEYIKSYGRSGSGAARDKAKALYNKCKKWQIQVALVSGMSPGARSSGYKWADVEPVVEALDSYNAESLSNMIPWLEWAAKLPQPPEK